VISNDPILTRIGLLSVVSSLLLEVISPPFTVRLLLYRVPPITEDLLLFSELWSLEAPLVIGFIIIRTEFREMLPDGRPPISKLEEP